MDRTARLHLLRHAKSSWDDPSLRDAERPLAPRGRRAIELLRRHFQAVGLQVDLVLCSPARRTRETWDGVRAGLQGDPKRRLVPDIYEASADRLLRLVRGVDEAQTSVLLIGHNPGMEQLAAALIDGGEPVAIERLGEGFPTGAFASFDVRSAWAALDWGTAHLDEFVRPRDLTAE